MGPETLDFWWNSRPKTRDPCHRWDPGPETLKVEPMTRDPTDKYRSDQRPGTLTVDFLKNFLVFSDTLRLWMNSCDLCVYVSFVCFLLPCHKAYKPLTFHHPNDLNLSCFQVFAITSLLPPCSCYEIFRFPTKPLMIVRSQIRRSEKDLNRWK